MSSILHRRRAVFTRGEQDSSAVPEWQALIKMDAPEVEELAGRLGIEYTSRSETLSAINKAR